MGNIIKFDTGAVEYSINDAVTVTFNPTDLAFVERVFNIFDHMDEKQEEYNSAISKVEKNAEVFAVFRSIEGEMREMIDDVFGAEVCQSIFGNMSVFALAEGLPLWANLMLALIDEMDVAFAKEKKATNPRIKKYTAKYKRTK